MEFLKFFRFTNQWDTSNRRQADKIFFGLSGDWSSCIVEATARVGIVNLFGFGLDWSDADYEGFITILNFKLGVKVDKG